jgi:hypothetical protein
MNLAGISVVIGGLVIGWSVSPWAFLAVLIGLVLLARKS